MTSTALFDAVYMNFSLYDMPCRKVSYNVSGGWKVFVKHIMIIRGSSVNLVTLSWITNLNTKFTINVKERFVHANILLKEFVHDPWRLCVHKNGLEIVKRDIHQKGYTELEINSLHSSSIQVKHPRARPIHPRPTHTHAITRAHARMAFKRNVIEGKIIQKKNKIFCLGFLFPFNLAWAKQNKRKQGKTLSSRRGWRVKRRKGKCPTVTSQAPVSYSPKLDTWKFHFSRLTSGWISLPSYPLNISGRALRTRSRDGILTSTCNNNKKVIKNDFSFTNLCDLVNEESTEKERRDENPA